VTVSRRFRGGTPYADRATNRHYAGESVDRQQHDVRRPVVGPPHAPITSLCSTCDRAVVLISAIVVAVALEGCEDGHTPTQPTASVAFVGLKGVLRDQLPESAVGLPVAGASVEIVGKPGVVLSTITDAQGEYSFHDVGGSFDVKASKIGYRERTQHIGPVREDTTVDLTIEPLQRLIGTVTESPPSDTTPIAGSSVQVLNGAAEGRSASTDPAGRFSIYGVSGDFDVVVSRDGYESKTVHVSTNGITTTVVNLMLVPDVRQMRTTVFGRVCADYDFYLRGNGTPPGPCRLPGDGPAVDYPVQQHHYLPVHRSGTVRIDLHWIYREDYSDERMWLEVRCGSNLLALKSFSFFGEFGFAGGSPFGKQLPLIVPAAGPCLYEIKALRYSSFKTYTYALPWTEYRLDIDHPQ
jgi:Carboxypeptidase regulatory-like domain